VPVHAIAQDYLDAVAVGLRRGGLRVTTHVLTADDAAAALAELAILEEVDLIAMATHGRGGLGRWRYGSVADAVSRGAPVPVLLVRSPAVPAAAPLDATRREALPHAAA
jgi:nucleotide-binding universal stress UspA family protein